MPIKSFNGNKVILNVSLKPGPGNLQQGQKHTDLPKNGFKKILNI